jgi:hypothetical protein
MVASPGSSRFKLARPFRRRNYGRNMTGRYSAKDLFQDLLQPALEKQQQLKLNNFAEKSFFRSPLEFGKIVLL